jgi:8-oxo-dGTP diphosphatase
MRIKGPGLAVDGVILLGEAIVLVKRRNQPYAGMWALPGGFVEYGETVEDAVKREILEETGLKVEIEKLAGIYSDPKRDPRGHTVSVVFLCKKTGGSLKADSDAADVGVFPLAKLPHLAFDHRKIIDDLLL